VEWCKMSYRRCTLSTTLARSSAKCEVLSVTKLLLNIVWRIRIYGVYRYRSLAWLGLLQACQNIQSV
jgi:hypothetical protein